MASFLDGGAAMSCLAVAVFFARFWRESGDRLFVCLAAAFACFAINYSLLGLLPLADEWNGYAFGLRLVGFVAILMGVTLKDRELAEHLRAGDADQLS